MAERLSPRLAGILEALPLRPGLRVLEIGCGPGALARAMAARVAGGYMLGIDRSAKAIGQAVSGSSDEIAQGILEFRHVAADMFRMSHGQALFDLAVAIRVGALDGRHPDQQEATLRAIAAALGPRGRLLIDGGDPFREISLTPFR